MEFMEYGKVLLDGKAPNGIVPYIIIVDFLKLNV